MSDFLFNFEDADDNDDFTESDSDGFWTGKDATIFVIDASPEMFTKPSVSNQGEDEEDCPFIKSLRCVHSTVARKIISNDQDFYSVILFNTTKANNKEDFPNIFVLQELDQPGAERMIQLENLLEDGNGDQAKIDYGSTAGAKIYQVLWACRDIFKSKKNLMTKNILLFTCNDDPHSASEHMQSQAFKGAKATKEAGIEIEILPFGVNFNPKKFYKELLSQGNDDNEEESESLSVLANPADRFDELLERVRCLEHKQRTTGKVAFSIGPGLEMGVKVFTAIREAGKPRKVRLYKVTNEEVISRLKEYSEDGTLLMPSDFVKYREYGGKKIKMSLDEVRLMSKVYEPGIELLGFKPLTDLKPYLYIKPANFIYPDEVSIKGSNRLFACLLERCVAREVCPVVRVVSRVGGSVSWAFLLPQEEIKDDKGCQIKPPGFHICYLPFADDFRLVELSNRTRANTDQVDAAKEFMKKLHFKYHPDCFENPELQTHWRNLEALALNREYLEPVKDYTVPDHEKIQKKAGQLIEQFKALVLPGSYDAEAVAKKRPPPATSTDPAPKRPKQDHVTPQGVEGVAREKQVNKLSVPVLKEWLQERGVRVGGKKKAQLVQDVYDQLGIEV